MKINNAIFILYLIITLYLISLSLVSSFSIFDMLLPLIIMWGVFIFYFLGYQYPKIEVEYKNNLESKIYMYMKKDRLMIILTFISVFSAVISINYYTGQLPTDIINNLTSDVSVYNEYQKYFIDQNIASFSIFKLPYILMMFFVKLILIWTYVSKLLIKDKINNLDRVILIIVTLSYLYIGFGRGTNFEFFEWIVISLMILLVKIYNGKNIIKKTRGLLIIVILIISGIFLYLSRIESRGIDWAVNLNTYNPDIQFDFDSLMYRYLPGLAEVIYSFYGYFGFGAYYISSFITNLLFNSLGDFLAALIPHGFIIKENSSIQEIMGGIIDIGVSFNPDIINFINNIGIIGLLVFIFLLGMITRLIVVSSGDSIMKFTTYYVILLQFISFPIGSFLFLSSSNELLIFLVFVYWMYYWLFISKNKIRKFS